MGDYYQMTISDWLASKTEEIRQELGKAAQSFVAIGYKLKEVRDSGNLAEGETIADYAQREFGLSASTTSRFIAINEKFGEGLELKHEYIGIGSGKLQEMLTLSDADCELINQNHTVKQIREIKAFESQDTPVESEAVQQHGAFEKCIIDFFKDKPKLLNDICLAEYTDTEDYKRAADMISPNGSTTHKKGIVFMFAYQFDEGIKYKIFGEQAARQMSYIEFINTIRDIFSTDSDLNPHEAFYGVIKEAPVEEKSTNSPVATSQVTESVNPESEYKESVSESHEDDNESQEVDNAEETIDAEYEEIESEPESADEVQQDDNFVEAEAEALADDIEHDSDPRKELQDDLEYYCKELVEASKWPATEAAKFRERSDELVDLILNTRKELLMLNFKLKNEIEDDED